MKTKTILIFIIFILNSIQVIGVGLGDWKQTTINGTTFDDPGGGTRIYLKNGKEFNYGDEWYFYKNHIIGKGKNWDVSPPVNNFFIIDERKVEIYIFEKDSDWKKYIDNNELNPKYWKRSFRDNWDSMDFIPIFIFFWFPISIPIILLNVYFIVMLFKANDDWRKWLFFSLVLPLILIILNFMGNHPQSI